MISAFEMGEAKRGGQIYGNYLWISIMASSKQRD